MAHDKLDAVHLDTRSASGRALRPVLMATPKEVFDS